MDNNSTPSASRLHIGIFGKTNSGKSSFINTFTDQKVSIVSDISGTTTDPVHKAMEVPGLGACTLIDTAGFDDTSSLGVAREEKTVLAAEKCDIAIIVVANDIVQQLESEYKWAQFFKERNTPVLFVINKSETNIKQAEDLAKMISTATKCEALVASCNSGLGMPEIRQSLIRMLPADFGNEFITGNLVSEGDVVLLVMPQDIQAPKGRLILAQSQTIRELLDRKCLTCSVTTDKLEAMLEKLNEPPKLIITDSQVFDYVYNHKPAESMLTSFSVLMAAYKGDLPYYLEGAKAIDLLNENSHILIAECCTHAPVSEDIGRVKIPRMLRKRAGNKLSIDIVSGTDFPDDLSDYDLVIQCGGCMFNRKYILSRIEKARAQNVPMTNYGVTIAHLTGILDNIVHT